MKKHSFYPFIVLCFVILPLQGFCQIATCGATIHFANFANEASFKDFHQPPLSYTHHSQAGGKMISFHCPDGTNANGYLITAKTKTNNWIFVFQEWWGLNEYIKKESEKLFMHVGNVNVLALDMYDGKVATTRETASKLMQAFTQERGNAIVKGAMVYTGKKSRIATIGWCFGGGQSMQAALTAGKQEVACVIYYGMPEENVDRLMKLNSDVLFIWATQDKWINKEVVEKFKNNMLMAGRGLQLKEYDADHAFANPSNPLYHEKFSESAFKSTVDYMKARFESVE